MKNYSWEVALKKKLIIRVLSHNKSLQYAPSERNVLRVLLYLKTFKSLYHEK